MSSWIFIIDWNPRIHILKSEIRGNWEDFTRNDASDDQRTGVKEDENGAKLSEEESSMADEINPVSNKRNPDDETPHASQEKARNLLNKLLDRHRHTKNVAISTLILIK